MPGFHLDPRLNAVASLVQPGNRVIDVGTDHAYLPCALVLRGVCPSAVASDLRPGPLENAKGTIAACGLEAKIAAVLSDGLDALSPQKDCTVVLAGMGGLLIVELLSRTAWVFDPSVQIVAQPMSHAEDVRRFFFERGFALETEVCAEDGRHLYCAMAARFTGEPTQYSPAMPYGGQLLSSNDPLAKRYLQMQFARLKKRRDALANAQADPEEVERLNEILRDAQRVVQYR